MSETRFLHFVGIGAQVLLIGMATLVLCILVLALMEDLSRGPKPPSRRRRG